MKQLKKIGKFLCSMKFAVILLVILALACTVGSVIPQGEQTTWYTANYSTQAAGAILLFGLDDLFHCWWFVALTLFLCLNLLCCNVLRFPSLYRRMKNGFTPVKRIAAWNKEAAIETTEEPDKLFAKLGFRKVHSGKIAAATVAGKVQEATAPETGGAQETETPETSGAQEMEIRYAVKNKAGIWGAWLCHLGMLIIIAGFGLGQMLKTEYTVYGVPGQTKPVGDTSYELTIDEFEVKLREDDTVDQYTSVLTVTDTSSGKMQSGEASVNAPLSLFGMKFYQNSTGWAATLEVYREGEKLQENLLCAGEYAEIEDKEGLAVVFNAFYPDYYEDEDGQPMTLSSALKNPGYLYSIYYNNQIVGMNVLTQDEKITVEDYEIIFRDPQQYTLIQVKRDPFGMLAAVGGLLVLCALILAFYLYPQELWAVKGPDNRWRIAGRSRKSGTIYTEEIVRAWSELEKEEKNVG